MTLPQDYLERLFAGVLGKIIGVYLGRPVEGWSYERIIDELGEVWYYVNDKLGLKHLVITDDDISGTFTFLRALPDHGNSLNLTPAQIGVHPLLMVYNWVPHLSVVDNYETRLLGAFL